MTTINKFINIFFLTSKRATYNLSIFFIVLFVFETFFPLGDIIANSFGTFGTLIGNILFLYSYYIYGRSFYFFLNDNKND